MCMRLTGPMEGRRHDWTLYKSSGLNNTLQKPLFTMGSGLSRLGTLGTAQDVFFIIRLVARINAKQDLL